MRHGGICYIDEIVEARKDTTVVIHSLTDDRRVLYIDKTGEVVRADDSFMMVLSYNPGYQSVVKDLKQSMKQRFASLSFDNPQLDIEARIVETETGLDAETSRRIAEMGRKIREPKGYGLDEGVSSRLLAYVGRLMRQGLPAAQACDCAISQTLTDARDIRDSIGNIVALYFGELGRAEESGS